MSGNKGLSQNIEVDTVLWEYMSIHSDLYSLPDLVH